MPTYKVEDVVVRGRHSISANGVGLSSIKRAPNQMVKCWSFGLILGFLGGLHARWEVTKATYPYMLAICLVYFGTLSIYPGVVSEIESCTLKSWMPIIMISLFNIADLLGKTLAGSSAR